MKVNKRKLLLCGCILMACMMIMLAVLCLNFNVFSPNETAYAQETDGGGTGTQDDPYLIGTAATLNSSAMRTNFATANKQFKLIADIDLISITNWNPITTFAAGCVLDGDGYKIKNLKITGGSTSGLFARVTGGTIKNLIISDIDIAGNGHVGGIAGIAYGTVICTDVYMEGGNINNTSSMSRTGGFFGQLTSTINLTIDKCYVKDVDIIGGNSTGGFFGLYESGSGSNNKITITNSYHTGDINGKSNIVGGLAGGVSSGTTSTVIFENCFHIGKLHSGGYMVGGIIGYTNASGTIVNIINCYSIAELSQNSRDYNTGGLYGGADNYTTNVNIVNSYYDETLYPGGSAGSSATNVTKDPESGGKSTSEMQSDEFIDLLGDGFVYNPEPPHYPIVEVLNPGALIKFDYNYPNAPAIANIRKAFGLNIENAMDKPERTGYNFIEWTENSNGTGAVYRYDLAGFIVDETNTQVSTDSLNGKTLYAKWGVKHYNLIPTGDVSTNGSLNVTLENRNTTIRANAVNFAYWEVKLGNSENWESLYGQSETILNMQDILDENFILSYADETDIEYRTISIRAVHAPTYTLTVKSDQKSFGNVYVNGIKLDYDTTINVKQGDPVELLAEANDYYNFKEFKINGVPETSENTEFFIMQNTVVLTTFEKTQYSISISSKYVSGAPIEDLAVFPDNMTNESFSIGDEIPIFYDVNRSGYKFDGLSILGNEFPYDLDADGSGIYYLKLTKEILDNYLSIGIQVVARYIKQYVFSVRFTEGKMYNWYEILEAYVDNADRRYLNLDQDYVDDGAQVVLRLRLRPGYHLNSVSGLSLSDFEEQDSILTAALTIISDKHIEINLIADKLNLTVSAFDMENQEEPAAIPEVFGDNTEFIMEYNTESGLIERNPLSGYRFMGWYIYNYDINDFELLNARYLSGDRLSVNFGGTNSLEDKYIDNLNNARVEAWYMPVSTLTLNADGPGDYTVYANNNPITGEEFEFDYGTKITIVVTESEYIDFSGFAITGAEIDLDASSTYTLIFTLNSPKCTVDFDFEAIEQTLNISENLSKAKGKMKYETSGSLNGNAVKAGLGETVSFIFDLGSGQKLKNWKLNDLNYSEIVNQGYGTFNNSVLTLTLNKNTLDWLKSNQMNLDVAVETQFNPVFTALIIGGGIIAAALAAGIIMYVIANGKKKKQIAAAYEAGIVGAARFNISFNDAIDAKPDNSEPDIDDGDSN